MVTIRVGCIICLYGILVLNVYDEDQNMDVGYIGSKSFY